MPLQVINNALVVNELALVSGEECCCGNPPCPDPYRFVFDGSFYYFRFGYQSTIIPNLEDVPGLVGVTDPDTWISDAQDLADWLSAHGYKNAAVSVNGSYISTNGYPLFNPDNPDDPPIVCEYGWYAPDVYATCCGEPDADAEPFMAFSNVTYMPTFIGAPFPVYPCKPKPP